MAYKAQLVVRSTTKEGVEIIEQVKEMASTEGKTFSDMAVELLGRALSGTTSPPAEAADEDEDKVQKSAAADRAPAKVNGESALALKTAASTKPAADKSAIPAQNVGPVVDPKLPPKEIVSAYLASRQEDGEHAAARILVDFFAVAGPKPGGQVKKLLQQEFDAEEFTALMAPIKKTREYRAYTDRAIHGAPSPYSQMSPASK